MSAHRQHPRSGNVIILVLLMLITLMVVVAMAVDLGYVQVVSAQLQRSADAAAIAGAWKLVDQQKPGTTINSTALDAVRTTAGQYAGFNEVINAAPGLSADDTTIGHLGYPYNGTVAMTFNQPSQSNAVQVRVRRTDEQNGAVGLFFARVIGINTCSLEAEATATFLNNIAGFKVPANNQNLGILPFTLDKPTWDDLMAKMALKSGGTDQYKYDEATGQVTSGSDGVFEVNLYPEGTGSPGNRGTVDIGSSNNSTADISRQIRNGISPQELAHHGGQLVFDGNGELELNGDTGISAAVKDDLGSIVGKPRIIPIFTTVVGPGNNAQYTIVQWAGVRVLYVKLTGSMSSKKVIIQPAKVLTPGAIPSPGPVQSQYVYSPVWLVR